MNKLLKSIMAVAAGAVMVCGVAACNPDDGGVDADGNTVVKIMFHVAAQSAEGVAYQKRVTAFNEAYKSQKIKASAQFTARSATATSFETELTNQKMEGKLADIITFDAPNCASYADAGILYDISDMLTAQDLDDYYSVNKYDGKVYGLPIQESSAGFYYNKKIFREAGVLDEVQSYTVENPWTFEQFKAVCAKLKTAGVEHPVDMRIDATNDETATYLLYPFIYAAGGEFTSEDGYTAKLTDTNTVKGFQFIKDLVDLGYTSNTIGGTKFFSGEGVGMYLSAGWTIPDLEQQYAANFTEGWGLLPYPKDVKAASATGSWSYGITDNNKKDKTAAEELLKWMSSAESMKVVTDATGMIPARHSVETNYEAGSPRAVLLSQLETSGTARPATVAYPKFSTVFGNTIIASFYQSGSNLSETLTKANNDLQSEMNRLKARH